MKLCLSTDDLKVLGWNNYDLNVTMLLYFAFVS